MNKNLFLSVATAALIAGSGLSYAQGPAGGAGGAAGGGAGAAQQSAPSGGGAAGGGMSGGAASERGAPGGGAMNRDAAEPRGGAAKQSTQSNETAPGAKGDAKGDGKGGMNKNADTKGGADKEMNRNADSKDGAKDGMKDNNKNAQTKDGDKSGTMGQAGAGGKQLTTEQRTKVTTVIKQQNVQPITNINFSISVGTRVPREVRFNPLPAEIITVYPDWRGYEFFLARGEIIVVDPRTLEIVAVLPA